MKIPERKMRAIRLLLKQKHYSYWAQSAPFINLFRLFVLLGHWWWWWCTAAGPAGVGSPSQYWPRCRYCPVHRAGLWNQQITSLCRGPCHEGPRTWVNTDHHLIIKTILNGQHWFFYVFIITYNLDYVLLIVPIRRGYVPNTYPIRTETYRYVLIRIDLYKYKPIRTRYVPNKYQKRTRYKPDL